MLVKAYITKVLSTKQKRKGEKNMARKVNEAREEILKALKEMNNGCPLMENREKGDFDGLENETVTIDEAFPLDGYYCVTLKEDSEHFYLTSMSVTKAIDFILSAGETPEGLTFKVLEKVKTKNKNTYRPIEIISY